jgi:hypothetical protein
MRPRNCHDVFHLQTKSGTRILRSHRKLRAPKARPAKKSCKTYVVEDYDRTPICIVTVSGDTPAYHNMGELHFTDDNDIPIVALCYVQEENIKGHDKFALICNGTLVDIDADVNYHARTSREANIFPLKRLSQQPYHYRDSDKADKVAGYEDAAFHSNSPTST